MITKLLIILALAIAFSVIGSQFFDWIERRDRQRGRVAR